MTANVDAFVVDFVSFHELDHTLFFFSDLVNFAYSILPSVPLMYRGFSDITGLPEYAYKYCVRERRQELETEVLLAPSSTCSSLQVQVAFSYHTVAT